MSDNLQRNPNELWTSYLVRKMELEGLQVPDFEYDFNLDLGEATVEFNIDDTRLSLTRVLSLDEVDPGRMGARHANSSDFIVNIFSSESIAVKISDSEAIWFAFYQNGNVDVVRDRLNERFGALESYEEGKEYSGECVMADLVDFIKKKNSRIVISQNDMQREFLPELQPSKPQECQAETLEVILTTVKRLERIVADHPLVLQGEHRYLEALFSKVVNDDPGNLRVWEYEGRRIPYVLVHSSDLSGLPGVVSGNLYFVARDKAPEEWQQKIIAYHESLCLTVGHTEAKRMEGALANVLGKEKEYRPWRAEMDVCKEE